jgi:hypothetical protein
MHGPCLVLSSTPGLNFCLVSKTSTNCTSTVLPTSCARVLRLLSWAVNTALQPRRLSIAASDSSPPTVKCAPEQWLPLTTFRINTYISVASKRLYLPLESTLMKKGGRGRGAYQRTAPNDRRCAFSGENSFRCARACPPQGAGSAPQGVAYKRQCCSHPRFQNSWTTL